MSILSAVKTFIATCTSIDSPIWVDHLGVDPIQFAIIPLPGSQIVEEYIDGGSLREYPFALQSVMSTADELERIENCGFFETFSDWLEDKTAAGTFPTLASGQTAEEIEATGWAYLYEQGESGTGMYQLQCSLIYRQDP